MVQHLDFNGARTALQWYLDAGVEIFIDEAPVDDFAPVTPLSTVGLSSQSQQAAPSVVTMVESSKEALEPARVAANEAADLAALSTAMKAFDALDICQTASHTVLFEGELGADVMVIGDVPAEQDERAGLIFSDRDGVLLKKALSFIEVGQGDDFKYQPFYTHLIPWRPPGKRSLSADEIAVGLVFLERQLALVKPKAVLLCGAVAAQAMLGRREGISRLRGKQYDYHCLSTGLLAPPDDQKMLVSYHPSYLLDMPLSKRAFWKDLLFLHGLLANDSL